MCGIQLYKIIFHNRALKHDQSRISGLQPPMQWTTIVTLFSGVCGETDVFRSSFLFFLERQIREHDLCLDEQQDVIQRFTCDREHYRIVCNQTRSSGGQGSGSGVIAVEMSVWIPRYDNARSEPLTPNCCYLFLLAHVRNKLKLFVFFLSKINLFSLCCSDTSCLHPIIGFKT